MLSSDEKFAMKILQDENVKTALVGMKHDFNAYSKIDCVYIDVITKQEYDFLVKEKGARVITNRNDHIYSKTLHLPLCISQLVAADLKVWRKELEPLQIYHMDSEHRTKASCLVNYMILQKKTELEAIEHFARWEEILHCTERYHTFRLGYSFVPAFSYEIPAHDGTDIECVYETIFYSSFSPPPPPHEDLNDRVKFENLERDAIYVVFCRDQLWLRKRVRTGDEQMILQAIQTKILSRGIRDISLSCREKILGILSDVI